MAYLDKTGLTYFYGKIKGKFATKAELEELKARVTALETALGGLSFTVSDSVPTTTDEKKITFVKGG